MVWPGQSKHLQEAPLVRSAEPAWVVKATPPGNHGENFPLQEVGVPWARAVRMGQGKGGLVRGESLALRVSTVWSLYETFACPPSEQLNVIAVLLLHLKIALSVR